MLEAGCACELIHDERNCETDRDCRVNDVCSWGTVTLRVGTSIAARRSNVVPSGIFVAVLRFPGLSVSLVHFACW